MDMAEKACTSIATYQRIEKGDGTVALATVELGRGRGISNLDKKA